ncbi:MAG: uridine kinase [Lachnospiraceae bacterium]|nr:uridine kinase [Lachnospiraceae bacterium]
MDITIIGIAGGSASGKTTVVKKLQERFTGEIHVLGHDNYYKAHDNMPFSERTLLNYDHPDAFETEYMVRHIQELKEGRSIEHPTYDYTVHNRARETVFMEPRPVIVVEGILVLEDAALRNLMDLRIFVDTDAEERLARRILRDTKERGRSLESVLTQYTTTVKPMHEKFIEPSKKYADLIIPRGGHNKPALKMLECYIEALLARRNEREPEEG